MEPEQFAVQQKYSFINKFHWLGISMADGVTLNSTIKLIFFLQVTAMHQAPHVQPALPLQQSSPVLCHSLSQH